MVGVMESDITKLEHLRRLRKVLIYIERHLDEELSLEKLAKVGSFSVYHFHRIFRGIVGETPGTYVRRLRLERAAGHLVYSDERITDVALDASYDTPSAFTKAFKRIMGCSPAHYRETMPLTHQKQEDFEMNPSIRTFEDLSVLSVRRTGSYPTSAPAAWKALKDFVDRHGLQSENTRFIGVYHDNPDITAEENIRSEACCTAPANIPEEGEVMRKVIEGGRYATFEHKGPLNDLSKTFDGIFGNWYPQSGEKLADRPCLIELSEFPDAGDNPDTRAKVHIPLVFV